MSSYRLRYLITAPLILVVGLASIYGARKASAFGTNVKHWADSLDRGSGPVRIAIPVPVRISIGGNQVGSLDTIVVQRHQKHSVDSLRIVMKPLASANLGELPSCAVRVESFDQFDPGQLDRLFACASDTSGLTRFGTLSFGGSHDVALYVDAHDAACMAPSDEDVNVDVRTEAVNVAVQAPGVNVAVKTGPLNVAVNQHSKCGKRIAMSSGDIQRMVREAQAQSRISRAEARRIADEARQAAQAAREAAAAARSR